MALSESRRSQLDSIVVRMEAAKEADDEIGAVVQDFKSKYENESAPKAETPSMTEALLPAFSAARKGGERSLSDLVTEKKPAAGGLGRQALGLGSDALSGILRVPAALGRMADTHMGTAGDHPQGFRESLGQINRGENPLGQENFVSGMVKDPATMPSLAMGGPAIAGLGKMAVYGAKAGLTSAGLHQGDRIARGQGVDGGEAALEVGINTALPIVGKGVGSLIKKGAGTVKTILSKFSDVDEAALKAASNPETLQASKDIIRRTGGDLQGMTDELGKKTAAMQADETSAIASVNARRQKALEGGLLEQRPGAPGSQLSDVSAFDAGKGIETAAKGGMKRAGERFGRAQDDLLINQGLGKKGVEFGGIDGNQNPFEQAVDSYLSEAGVGRGGNEYGVIGNVSIPSGAINQIQSMKQIFKTANTTRDMLDQLRLVDDHLATAGPNGGRLFVSGSQSDLAVKGLRGRLDDALEAQIGRAAGKKKGEVVALWGAHREAYAKTRSAIENIQDGVGAGAVNQEAYFSRIKNIGVEGLREISALSKTNTDVAMAWNELRKGFYDNILAKSIKGDGVDFGELKKFWDVMDDDLKTVMLPTKIISHVDGILQRTKPVDFKGQTLADQNRWMGRDRQSTLGALENVGSKAKRTDLEDLKTLDDLLGLEGKDRFSEQAGSFYLGKQLGMTDKGALPLFTGSRTGAKLAGAGIGAGLGGSIGGSQGGAEGGGFGTGMGMLAGVAIQSPAGALAAYKLMNQIRKGVIVTERKVTRPLAQHGLSSGRLTRTLTTPQFGAE